MKLILVLYHFQIFTNTYTVKPVVRDPQVHRPPTSHIKPQFTCTDSFSYIIDQTSETTLFCETKGHFLVATSACFTCQ